MAEVVRTVSDGCIAHVSMKLDTAEVRAAHDGRLYEIIEKALATKRREKFMECLEHEQIESEKVKAAQEAIFKLAQIGLKTLLCMSALPAVINENSELELRLLLCRAEGD